MTAPQRAMEDLDKVAEALWRADHEGTTDVRGLEWVRSTRRGHYRSMALAAMDALNLLEEHNETVPVWVKEFNDDGSPVMHDDIIPAHQKSHIEWVAKRRLVTPWEEVGERRRDLM